MFSFILSFLSSVVAKTGRAMEDHFNLQYSQFNSNICEAFKTIRGVENFTDVTLACSDGEVSAHRLVLFTSSELFQEILPRMSHPKPYIYLKGIKLSFLESLMTFMYTGAVEVSQQDLARLLKTAKDLRVKGLIEATEEHREETVQRVSMIKSQMEEMMKNVAGQEEHNILEPQVNIEEPESDEPESQEIDVIEKELEADIPAKEEDNVMEVENVAEEESDLMVSDSDLSLLDETLDLDERALAMMEKSSTEDNRVCWLCKFCGKAGGDKSNIRRHVKSKHLKQLDRDKMSAQTTEQSEEYDVNDAIEVDIELDEAEDQSPEEISLDNTEDGNISQLDDLDLLALEMMEKDVTDDCRVTWTCKYCSKTARDKTRIRKHVISHMRDRKEKKVDEEKEAFKLRKTANYSPEDIKALKLMVKMKGEEGENLWSCTLCDKTHFDKFRIRRHILSNHKEALSV